MKDTSENERYKPCYALLISRILLRELLEHELFFVAQFYPDAYEYERRSDNSGDMPQHDDSADEPEVRGQMSAVGDKKDARRAAALAQFAEIVEGRQLN